MQDTPAEEGSRTVWFRPVGGLSELDLYRAVVEHLPEVSLFVLDTDLRYSLVAGAAISHLGWSPAEFLGLRPSDLLGPEDGPHLEDAIRAALSGKLGYHAHPGIRAQAKAWSTTVGPLRDDSGEIVGAVMVSTDVTALSRSEREREALEIAAVRSERLQEFERRQRERLEFLVEINDVLAGCRTQREVMQKSTAAAVPRLGDWCSLHVFVEEPSEIPEIELAHVDPLMVEHARELVNRFPYDPNGPLGVPQVIRTGQPEFHADLSGPRLETLGVSSAEVEVVVDLDLSASITVPVMKGDRIFGAMQFVISGSGRRYGTEDLTLAQAIAGRIAASLDNRRLVERQTSIAQTLQRSLLPGSLPSVEGAELAVRYWAAGEGTEVGGDFYDVFRIDDDNWAVVIGDVCGSGTQAAAVTALARHTIRANAWRGDTPEQTLKALNHAMLQTPDGIFCTVAYGIVSRSDRGLHMRVALAGHPAPVVVRANGAIELAGSYGLLVGVLPDIEYDSSELDLLPGDVMVFYTDGANDLPPPNGMATDDLVRLIASAVRGAPDAETGAENLAAALTAQCPFKERGDDIALVVVRAVDA